MSGTIIQFDGGHRTYVDLTVSEVEGLMSQARRDGHDFVYVQSDGRPPNSAAVDPYKVVALFAAQS